MLNVRDKIYEGVPRRDSSSPGCLVRKFIAPMNPSKRSLPALTGLRFFLALWVVIFHAFILRREPLAIFGSAIRNIFLSGYAAVSVFFILSGFVLAYSYNLDHSWSKLEYGRFAVARFSRIYPSYLLGLLLFAPLEVFHLYHNWSTVSGPVESLTAFLNFTLLQSWSPFTALTWNDPGWSLSNEAFFYVCFPLLGTLIWRAVTPASLWATGSLLFTLSVIGPLIALILPIHGYGDISGVPPLNQNTPAFGAVINYNPLLRLPEFLFGILVCRIYFQLQECRVKMAGKGYWFYLPGLIIVLVTLSQSSKIPYPLMHQGLLSPAYACIILGFALQGGWLDRFLSLPWLVFLGNASYSMYILHVPLRSWLGIGWKFTHSGLKTQAPFFVYLPGLILITSLNLIFIEEPLHKNLKRILQRRLT
jgi:peptidoglycan/LPS O-acetylase OafA/YrhL